MYNSFPKIQNQGMKYINKKPPQKPQKKEQIRKPFKTLWKTLICQKIL